MLVFELLVVFLLFLRPEEEVGFEDHILLDHLIADGFPKKGMVLHLGQISF